ncbi:hypothetical protein HAHE_11880 [Haloferula helveola]|uniref:HEAT repeat domain-containing protein n=1 Tax=Haloferula helveola TaxID=490095 RepID=A0ABM7RD39_9BACT|nr:hypothetical protein HAHE_11880 [Haloferula helveola]
MKLPSWSWNAGGLALALVAGVMIGRGTGGGSQADAASGNDGVPPRPGSRAEAGGALGDGVSATRRERDSDSVVSGRRTSAAGLQSILDSASRIDRTQRLLAFLDRLPDGEFASVYEKLRDDPGSNLLRSERSLLLQAWAERDPYAVTSYLQENGAEDWERENVLGSWAAADPQAAFAWALDAPDGGDVNNWVVGAIRGAAATDPMIARDLLGQIESSETRRNALRNIEEHVTRFGYDYAEGWIAGVSDEGMRNEASRRFADELAELDPVRAGDWNAMIADTNTRRDVSETVSDRWARQDLDSAKAWVNSLPEDTRTEAAEGVARHYARQDPAEAAVWLASLGNNPDLDGAKRIFVDEAFRNAPEVSMNFVANIADERSRTKSYYRYIGEWMRRDEASAKAWTESNAQSLPSGVVKRYLR